MGGVVREINVYVSRTMIADGRQSIEEEKHDNYHRHYYTDHYTRSAAFSITARIVYYSCHIFLVILFLFLYDFIVINVVLLLSIGMADNSRLTKGKKSYQHDSQYPIDDHGQQSGPLKDTARRVIDG